MEQQKQMSKDEKIQWIIFALICVAIVVGTYYFTRPEPLDPAYFDYYICEQTGDCNG